MPIQKPHKGEKEDEFMHRCMTDVPKEEYPDQDQRVAICISQWKRKEEKGGMEEEVQSSIYFSIRAGADDEAEVLLYGDIGQGFFDEGNGAKEFIEGLKPFSKAKNLNVRINSGGGSVFEGLAIYNAIERHQAKSKTVYIDGLAASIASLIAMAGNKTVIADNAMMMIHNPFGMVMGNADEMRATAAALDKVKEGMVISYRKKSKLPAEQISKLMDDETWMTADEARKMGFADEIGKSMQLAASFDFSYFKKVPPSLSQSASVKKVSPISIKKTEANKQEDKTVRLLPSGLAVDPNPLAIISEDKNANPQFVSSENHLVKPEVLERLGKRIRGGK